MLQREKDEGELYRLRRELAEAKGLLAAKTRSHKVDMEAVTRAHASQRNQIAREHALELVKVKEMYEGQMREKIERARSAIAEGNRERRKDEERRGRNDVLLLRLLEKSNARVKVLVDALREVRPHHEALTNGSLDDDDIGDDPAVREAKGRLRDQRASRSREEIRLATRAQRWSRRRRATRRAVK